MKDLAILSKMVKEVEFTKQNDKNKHFCKACALGKAHKMHSKKPAEHRTKSPDERLHFDIFGSDETLSGIDGYRYEAIVVNDYSRIKFPLILKAKDEIAPQIKALFNRVKNHTGRKIKFFRTDDDREFLPLTGVLNEKGIT
jgi:hypothetical protein